MSGARIAGNPEIKGQGAEGGLHDVAHVLNIIRDMDESLIVLSPDAEISFVNRAALDLLGYSSGEMAGVPFGRVVADDNLEFFRALREIITKGPVRDFRLEYLSRDGDRIPVSVNGSALKEDGTGKLLGIVVVARDMRSTLSLIKKLEEANSGLEARVAERTGELERAYAELKRTQAQLLQSEKLASIGQLAAGVAHEINNPVAFLLGNLGAVESYMKDMARLLAAYDGVFSGSEDTAGQKEIQGLKKELDIDFILKDASEVIREARAGVERVKGIVTNLKDFSRVGAVEAEAAYADINRCLESTVNIASSGFHDGIRIIKEYGMIPEVKCNAGELNQVFLNLVMNAAQAISGDGVISLRTHHGGGRVYVEVADTGCGIREENLPRIFEPFFTTKPVGSGTGLGLSMSYGIIKHHKGEISVRSRVGHGTTFVIALPV